MYALLGLMTCLLSIRFLVLFLIQNSVVDAAKVRRWQRLLSAWLLFLSPWLLFSRQQPVQLLDS
jgi:hypothetical protein